MRYEVNLTPYCIKSVYKYIKGQSIDKESELVIKSTLDYVRIRKIFQSKKVSSRIMCVYRKCETYFEIFKSSHFTIDNFSHHRNIRKFAHLS